MARTIKKIAHDLLPLSDVTSELSLLISQLLAAVKPHASLTDSKAAEYFDECAKAAQNLAVSAKLIREYIEEVNSEADSEGIVKE